MTAQTFFPGETLTASEMNSLSEEMLTIDGTATMVAGADLTLGADPTQPKQAATMEWVQAQIAAAGLVGSAGGTFNGEVYFPAGIDVGGPPGFGCAIGTLGQISQAITNAGTGNVSYNPYQVTFSPVSDRGSGGYTGFSAVVLYGTISQNPDNSGSRFNTEFESVQLTVKSTAGQGSNGHSALGTHVTKQLPLQYNNTSYAMQPTDTLPACWALYGTAVDISGLPTSQAGPLACQEFDMQVTAIDDAGDRGGYTFNLDVKSGTSSGICYATAAQGLYSYGLNDAWIWNGHRTAGNHMMSAHDSRAINGPETTVSVTSTGTIVSVTNAVPYSMGSSEYGQGIALPLVTVPVQTAQSSTSATVQFAPGSISALQTGGQVIGTNIPVNTSVVSANNTTGVVVMSNASTAVLTAGQEIQFCGFNPIKNVLIGANTYQVNYSTIDSPSGTSGKLYLSSDLQGTDGNAGNTVARPFYALIMRTGDRIAFDVDGNVQMYYDSAVIGGAGGVHLKAGLQVDQQLSVTGVVTLSTTVNCLAGLGCVTFTCYSTAVLADGFSCTGGVAGFPTYYGNGVTLSSGQSAVPNPGVISPGAQIFIANALKPGETSGSGTGVFACVNNNRNAWLRVGDYTTVTY